REEKGLGRIAWSYPVIESGDGCPSDIINSLPADFQQSLRLRGSAASTAPARSFDHAWIPEKSWRCFSPVFGLRDEGGWTPLTPEVLRALTRHARGPAMAVAGGVSLTPASHCSQQHSVGARCKRARLGQGMLQTCPTKMPS